MHTRQFRFSKKLVDALPACPAENKSKEIEYSDAEVTGLRLLVNRIGRKSFLFRYTHDGKKRSMKIGKYPDIDIADARTKAFELRALLAKGVDPQGMQGRQMHSLTFRQFFAEHLWPHFEATKRSAKADESRIRCHVLPAFGERNLCDITSLELQQFHNRKKLELCPSTANRIFELIQRGYNLANLWGLVDHNPAKGIRLHRENNRRERFLSDDELRRFLTALKNEKNRSAADAFLFLLATGSRREEALGAKWQDVDLDKRVWYLPHTKSGKSRYVLLNDTALDVLNARKLTGAGAYIFPGINGERTSNPTRAWKRVLQAAGIDPSGMRIHDLRHTHASYLVGVASLHEIAGLLGHANTTTTQRYAHLNSDRLRTASAHVSTLIKEASLG
ncbi:tyrosine-type recombinase/integrase [Burkholderiaceae bacterium DAT-1]|nr:tyrosine-type recombinase/integrase [Burkholderiaceae bacterium DAT-1]